MLFFIIFRRLFYMPIRISTGFHFSYKCGGQKSPPAFIEKSKFDPQNIKKGGTPPIFDDFWVFWSNFDEFNTTFQFEI